MEDKPVNQLNSLLIENDTLSSLRITSRPTRHCARQSKTMMSPSLPSPREFPSCKTCLIVTPQVTKPPALGTQPAVVFGF